MLIHSDTTLPHNFNLTGGIIGVLRHFLSTQQYWEGVSAVVGFMDLPDLHCVIHQVVVQDLRVCVYV